MTVIYFVRHAQADNTHRDERTRPLTEKGMADRVLVTEYLADKAIDAVFSSPYRRAVDTVADFAEKYGFEIEIIEDFREHNYSNTWLPSDEYFPIVEKQWLDFSHKNSGAESFDELQKRNIAALDDVLARYAGKNIAIGTHGAALSTIINYFDNTYGYQGFMSMVFKTPWIVKMTFDGNDFNEMEKIDLLPPN